MALEEPRAICNGLKRVHVVLQVNATNQAIDLGLFKRNSFGMHKASIQANQNKVAMLFLNGLILEWQIVLHCTPRNFHCMWPIRIALPNTLILR